MAVGGSPVRRFRLGECPVDQRFSDLAGGVRCGQGVEGDAAGGGAVIQQRKLLAETIRVGCTCFVGDLRQACGERQLLGCREGMGGMAGVGYFDSDVEERAAPDLTGVVRAGLLPQHR